MSGVSKKILKGGKIIDPSLGLNGEYDLLLEGNKIIGLDRPGIFNNLEVAETIELNGKIVAPGFIDIHVHLREPGEEWKETVLTGTDSAVAGGFTAVACMPNTIPRIDNKSVVEFVLAKARSAKCRVYPIGTITVGIKGKELSPFLELVEAGCVAFSDDGSPVSSSLSMRRALEYNKMTGAILAVHEEDEDLAGDFSMNEGEMSLKLGLKGMPGAAEDIMIARDIELARLTGGRVHFLHVSTARAVTLIRRAKEDGIAVTAEVLPHNITLDEGAISGFNTNAKMSMPLRTQADMEGLLQGLKEGVIDCVSTDHAPHEEDSKRVEFDKAAFGIIGFETAIPVMLGLVRKGKISLERVIESLSSSPARCFNLKPNQIKVGNVADLTIIDLEDKFIYRKEDIRSKSKNSPYINHEFVGRASHTIVNGQIVFSHNYSKKV